jgi:glycerophosphoryl diester phosphodiesterase
MMEIISHRGYWKTIEEKNGKKAFERSFELGFGTETDIRDFNGELVISHDIADSNCMKLDSFLELYNKYNNPNLTLALNIKSDGLQIKLFEQLKAFGIENYFVFDMSIPDTIGYLNNRIPFFSRQSEYEKKPVFYENCSGIWLDSFDGIWFNKEMVLNHLDNNKRIAIVSSELHIRDSEDLWGFIKSNKLHPKENIILCTDKPEEAIKYYFDNEK